MDPSVDAQFSSFPRIFALGPSEPAVPPCPAAFEAVANSFEAATGWVLEFQESTESRKVRAQVDTSFAPLGNVTIVDMSPNWPAGKNTASRERCDELAKRLSDLFSQHQSKTNQLRLAQAELEKLWEEQELWELDQQVENAIPVNPTGPTNSYSHDLAPMLGSLLGSACDLSQADRGAVYLLDDASENLVARCVEGPSDLIGHSRTVKSTVADVEAMAGAVIVMEDRQSVMNWDCPVDCKSAVCVPVTSRNKIYGTMWIFSNQVTDYSDQATNVLEIVAGRIAAELELDQLRGVAESESFQAEDSFDLLTPEWEFEEETLTELDWEPSFVAPPFDGWSALLQGEESGIARWFVSSDEQLIAVVGADLDEYQTRVIDFVSGQCESGQSLSAKELGEALQQLLECGHDRGESLAIAVIDPLSGEMELAQIGDQRALPMFLLDRELQELRSLDAEFRGFLGRGQSVVLGGGAKSCDINSLFAQLTEPNQAGSRNGQSQLILSRS